MAIASDSTAVVGVGLAPGLTTLLAAACIGMLQDLESVDNSILGGAGDSHGEAAIRWIMQNLLSGPSEVSSKEIEFGSSWKKRRAVLFAFADQYSIRDTMNVPEAVTRLAIDSRLIMTGFQLLQYWSRRGRMRSFLIGESFAQMLGRVKIGSDWRRRSQDRLRPP